MLIKNLDKKKRGEIYEENFRIYAMERAHFRSGIFFVLIREFTLWMTVHLRFSIGYLTASAPFLRASVVSQRHPSMILVSSLSSRKEMTHE